MTGPNKYEETSEGYDEEAEAAGWLGAEVAFGLMYRHVRPGQSILDIGIGTGLGSILFKKAGLLVYGIDLSRDMLDACRRKGIAELTRHDLLAPPYPYGPESMDHAICLGVLHFFGDLSPVFGEAARILRKGGFFAFTVGDRAGDEPPEILVGPEDTKTGGPVTMYRHTPGQIGEWAGRYGFALPQSLSFTAYMDRERTRAMPIRIFLARKGDAEEPA
jgi:predicted TPR repeat methyltransferase